MPTTILQVSKRQDGYTIFVSPAVAPQEAALVLAGVAEELLDGYVAKGLVKAEDRDNLVAELFMNVFTLLEEKADAKAG